MLTMQQYNLRPDWDNHIPLPQGATVHDVRRDGGEIVMWVSCDLSRSCDVRRFRTLRNHQEIPNNFEYLATVPVLGEVFHVFEDLNGS